MQMSEKVMELLKQAECGGDEDIFQSLALCYLYGDGVERDFDKAREWRKRQMEFRANQRRAEGKMSEKEIQKRYDNAIRHFEQDIDREIKGEVKFEKKLVKLKAKVEEKKAKK